MCINALAPDDLLAPSILSLALQGKLLKSLAVIIMEKSWREHRVRPMHATACCFVRTVGRIEAYSPSLAQRPAWKRRIEHAAVCWCFEQL